MAAISVGLSMENQPQDKVFTSEKFRGKSWSATSGIYLSGYLMESENQTEAQESNIQVRPPSFLRYNKGMQLTGGMLSQRTDSEHTGKWQNLRKSRPASLAGSSEAAFELNWQMLSQQMDTSGWDTEVKDK